MESFLLYPAIYLVSVDLNPTADQRFRVWRVHPHRHQELADRYREWMEKLGYPKLRGESRLAVNFQLFPPRNMTEDGYARHGNGRVDGFSKLRIELDAHTGSTKLFHAEITNNEVRVLSYS